MFGTFAKTLRTPALNAQFVRRFADEASQDTSQFSKFSKDFFYDFP